MNVDNLEHIIYLDYNATTPIDASVAEAMLPYLYTYFGNPSSGHVVGQKAKQAVETARAQVASMLGCKAGEIIFTSGGTESNNLAIRGYAEANRDRGNHIITCAVEHPAVLEVCQELERSGFALTVLPVDLRGRVRMDDLEAAITENTILISIMHANNEVGTIQPISEITRIAHSHNIAVHTDAAQSIGKIPVRCENLDVDLLSIAGHKLYAPKGIGALYRREGILLKKQTQGANHEGNLRPGTENVIGIVGLGKACELIRTNLGDYAAHYAKMRDRLEAKLSESFDALRFNGDLENRLPNTSSVSFFGRKADFILRKMSTICASAGAACHTDDVSISHVLRAMNVPLEYAAGTIRFSTGRATHPEDILRATEQVRNAVNDE